MISVYFLKKRRSENMQQICKRTTMPKCDFKKVLFYNFNEIELRHGCSPVNLLYIFRTPLPKNASGECLLPLIDKTNLFQTNNNFLMK